ncbi:50S ribosomal protein L25/general stress protein Ctc [Listeria weihenstephanensis FSL R9-0317]|uniref:Large ribosomal subunit protein bL25 n=1 Tax=Listeria weihenstephanensis TaxID=1006155 RepID=A0A1S7FQT9_9LIST|nr:50S ribosomal protein L25/general stress protein Ctc [Listeria weihenstephanensis]AQY49773.1 50S ribosomal protein L25 [Listeria weihenstephanensis]EUJ41074.1 50S ribosomal protein L25/general stress protein Ctc [Listeria weihenstephanensis FSL R9-0317]MBC1499047.1 50S ribosomal protein L25/general stress protein Ctc [Listeria weihenstephanensis]
MATTLEVQKRETKPHSNITAIRNAGRIPGVIYGYKAENVPVSVDALTFIKAVRDNGRNSVFSVTIDGAKLNVLLHDYQTDALKGDIEHIDLLAVDMSEEVEATVNISLVGESKGVKLSGVLQQVLYDLTVATTPDKLPEVVEVDITNLDIGDAITVADLAKNADYTVITDGEEVIATVSAPRSADEPETTSSAVTEPEAIHGSEGNADK